MMNVLIDTHIILWAATNDKMLSQEARDIILNPDNTIYYSTASIWEITIKHMARPDKMLVDGNSMAKMCDKKGYMSLPILNKHVHMLSTLERPPEAPEHHDPFDRILLAQAKAEELWFITHDKQIAYYNERFILSV